MVVEKLTAKYQLHSHPLDWAEGQPNTNPGAENCLHVKKDPLLRDAICIQQKCVICEGKPDQLHASQYCTLHV